MRNPDGSWKMPPPLYAPITTGGHMTTTVIVSTRTWCLHDCWCKPCDLVMISLCVMCFLIRVSDEPGWLHQYEPFCRLGASLQSGPLPAEIHGKLSIIVFSSSFIVSLSPVMGTQRVTRTGRGRSLAQCGRPNCTVQRKHFSTSRLHSRWCHHIDVLRECALCPLGLKGNRWGWGSKQRDSWDKLQLLSVHV